MAKVNVKMNERLDFSTKIDFSTTTNEGLHTSIDLFNYAYQRTRTLYAFIEDGSYHMCDRGSGINYNIL